MNIAKMLLRDNELRDDLQALRRCAAMPGITEIAKKCLWRLQRKTLELLAETRGFYSSPPPCGQNKKEGER